MPTPDATIVVTIRRYYFTEAQARNATVNQIAGGEPLSFSGSWQFGSSNQTLRSCVDLDVTQLENALTDTPTGATVEVFPVLPSDPEYANGARFMAISRHEAEQ